MGAEATRDLNVTLSVSEWMTLQHALSTAASHYQGDAGHEGVSEEIRALSMKLSRAFNSTPESLGVCLFCFEPQYVGQTEHDKPCTTCQNTTHPACHHDYATPPVMADTP